jgi:hypothetical protein
MVRISIYESNDLHHDVFTGYIPIENWHCALGASPGSSSALCPSKSFFKQRLLDRPLSNKPRPFLIFYGPGRTLVCHGAKHMECAQMPSRFSRTRHTGLSQISLRQRNGNTKISRDGLTRFSSSVIKLCHAFIKLVSAQHGPSHYGTIGSS